MKRHMSKIAVLTSVLFGLSGCVTTGQQYRADVFKAGQVNQAQQVEVIRILAVIPAQIEVDNSQQKKNAEVAGAVLGAILGGAVTGKTKKPIKGSSPLAGAAVGAAAGAAAGSMVSDKALVDGVSITYILGDKTLNSAQVGRSCEFSPGEAILIKSTPTETRVQPNAQCPVEGSKA